MIKLIVMIQLVSQLKGYFYDNAFLSISFIITIFSFAGIPPLIGFFAKQQVLSAALDKGYIFLSLVAIMTSVIGCVYYLSIIKEMFFYDPSLSGASNCCTKEGHSHSFALVGWTNITISKFISLTISIITVIILLFIVETQFWLSMVAMLANSLFNT